MSPRGFTGHDEEDDERYRASIAYIQSSGKKSKSAWRVVFRVAIVLLVASLAVLAVIAFSYLQGQQKYDRLHENVEQGPEAGIDALSVDWDALLAINPDTVAWLYIPGSNINYPVVRAADNEYYLNHDFYRDQGWLANFGAIFMDYRNAPNWQDDAYFIYGHHMNDGSMFADVANMTDQGKFNSCRTVYLLSPQGNFKLRTFAVVHCEADDPLVQITFTDAAEKTAYVQDKQARSLVQAADVKQADQVEQVFGFSTCDNFSSGRYVLYAYVEDKTVDSLTGSIGTDADGGVSGQVSDLLEE